MQLLLQDRLKGLHEEIDMDVRNENNLSNKIVDDGKKFSHLARIIVFCAPVSGHRRIFKFVIFDADDEHIDRLVPLAQNLDQIFGVPLANRPHVLTRHRAHKREAIVASENRKSRAYVAKVRANAVKQLSCMRISDEQNVERAVALCVAKRSHIVERAGEARR